MSTTNRCNSGWLARHHHTLRCELPAGHDGHHRYDDYAWLSSDRGAVQVEQPLPEPVDEPDRSGEEQDWIERTDRTV